MRLARKLVFAAIVLVIAGLLAWAYRPGAVAVTVERVTRGPLEVVVEEDGRTRIRERYVVTPPVAGYLRRLEIHAGDTVTAGQRLFELEPLPAAALDARSLAEARARAAQAAAAERAAEAEAAQAAAAAAFALRERARLRPLFDAGQLSKAQYDRAAADAERSDALLAAARAAADVARHERRAAETSLRYAAGERSRGRMTITAPVGGVVLVIEREDEGVVAAGAPILAIGDPGSLELVTDVLSSDAVRLRPGMPVRVDRWGGEALLEGRVRTVDPAAFTKVSALGVEEQRVRVISDLLAPREQWLALGDAYRVETRFVVWSAEDALRVPHSSLFREGAEWAVYVVAAGRLELRRVRIGRRGVLHAEVREGLAEGDTVVTYPDDTLRAGLRATPRGPAP